MSSALTRSGTDPEITEEEKAMLMERLKTADEDAQNAKDAYKFWPNCVRISAVTARFPAEIRRCHACRATRHRAFCKLV